MHPKRDCRIKEGPYPISNQEGREISEGSLWKLTQNWGKNPTAGHLRCHPVLVLEPWPAAEDKTLQKEPWLNPSAKISKFRTA